MYENVINTLNTELHRQGIMEYVDKEKHFVSFMEHTQLKEVGKEEVISCKENCFYFIVEG